MTIPFDDIALPWLWLIFGFYVLSRFELLLITIDGLTIPLFRFPITEEFKPYGFGNTKQLEEIPSYLIAPKRRLFPLLLLLALGV